MYIFGRYKRLAQLTLTCLICFISKGMNVIRFPLFNIKSTEMGLSNILDGTPNFIVDGMGV